MNIRTSEVTKTRKLKDGTIKKYKSKRTYIVKGEVEIGADGNQIARRNKFSAEVENEIRTKWLTGVTKARLCKDYQCSTTIINRICI